jgi:peptidoglycan lytic transglycosylase
MWSDRAIALGRLNVGVALATAITGLSSVSWAEDADHHYHRAASVNSADTGHDKARHHKTQTGEASVYARKLQGKKTASGQRFDEHKLTGASKTLPLHSKAKVTNLKTGKSVDVTITDRGPYAKHRVIDLSPAAAEQIGVEKKEGVAPVQVKPADAPTDGEVAASD